MHTYDTVDMLQMHAVVVSNTLFFSYNFLIWTSFLCITLYMIFVQSSPVLVDSLRNCRQTLLHSVECIFVVWCIKFCQLLIIIMCKLDNSPYSEITTRILSIVIACARRISWITIHTLYSESMCTQDKVLILSIVIACARRIKYSYSVQ